MRGGWAGGIALGVAVLAAPLGAHAQGQLSQADKAREAAAMLTAAGYRVTSNQILNSCGHPAQPRPLGVDLNGDGRNEAVISDLDAACYANSGVRGHVVTKGSDGQWRLIGIAAGRVKVLDTRTSGWRDYTIEGQGCQRTWTYDAKQAQYFSLQPCPGETGYRAPGTPPPAPEPTAKGGTPADRAAAFKAAGVAQVRGKYLACNKEGEMEIEISDLNGDGRPDALIKDYGSFCYGSTEQGYFITTKEANGAWRLLFQNQGIADFLTTRGVGGWPDIVNGGPGFCFPVLRWNGSDYAVVRWKADPAEPNACAGRR